MLSSRKTLIAALVIGMAGLSGSAYALDYGKTQAADDMRASKLIGTPVMNSAQERIGEIDELVMGMDGTASHAVIGVGGFLGIGEKAVAVPFSSVKLARDKDGNLTATVNAAKDELNSAPAYMYASDKKSN